MTKKELVILLIGSVVYIVLCFLSFELIDKHSWRVKRLISDAKSNVPSYIANQIASFKKINPYEHCRYHFSREFNRICFEEQWIERGLTFNPEIFAERLNVPWEIEWGPDGNLWFVERIGNVKRLDVKTGEVRQVHHLKDCFQAGSHGAFGLAFHPLFDSVPKVFISYNHSATDESGTVLRLSAFDYDRETDSLYSETIFLDSITGKFRYLQGGRLGISNDQKLFLTTTDASPAGLSADLDNLAGKYLRLNLDGTVPDDNPFPGSYIFSLGHRNPQGLAFTSNGRIYGSEHGDYSNDEVNLIEKGAHYGWPLVWGECDSTVEQVWCDSFNVVEPLKSWTPTIAPCNLIYYNHPANPAFRNSLLLVTLKESDVRQLRLDESGTRIIEEKIWFDGQFGRLRDITQGIDGSIYLSTSMHESFVKEKDRSALHDVIIRIPPPTKAKPAS